MILQPRPTSRDAKLAYLAALSTTNAHLQHPHRHAPRLARRTKSSPPHPARPKKKSSPSRTNGPSRRRLERRAREEGFRVHAIPAGSVRWDGSSLLRKLMRVHRFEIVHAHDP